VPAFWIVEAFDVIEHIGFGLISGPVSLAVYGSLAAEPFIIQIAGMLSGDNF
jgi:hypothetical protein